MKHHPRIAGRFILSALVFALLIGAAVAWIASRV